MEDAEKMAPAEPPREDMISTAVRFLQNPKVQQSPLSQRKAFLEKKGLTKEEVELAIERSGTPNVEIQQQPVTPHGGQMTNYVSQPQVIVAPVSTLSRVKDYLAYLIVASGATYGLYHILKKYLVPYLYGPSPKDEQLAKVEKGVIEMQQSLNETMKKLEETLSSLHSLMANQTDKVKVISEQITAQRGPIAMAQIQESQSTNEIKDEIKSLKGLLLSRKQFPPAPSTTPVLPAWQRTQPAISDEKKKPEESRTTLEGATHENQNEASISLPTSSSLKNTDSIKDISAELAVDVTVANNASLQNATAQKSTDTKGASSNSNADESVNVNTNSEGEEKSGKIVDFNMQNNVEYGGDGVHREKLEQITRTIENDLHQKDESEATEITELVANGITA